MECMSATLIDRAIELLEKANANLEPELLRAPDARKLLASYARAERLAAFGVAAMTRKVDNFDQVARITGTSIGKARAVVETGKAMSSSDDLNVAMRTGSISLDQATEIAAAERSAPGSAPDLLKVAKNEGFNVLKEKARNAKLEAEQHRGLGDKQRAARCARSYTDALGMVDIHLRFEPHIGTPIVARAETEAQRLARAAKKAGKPEPFERHLADGYAMLMAGEMKGRTRRPELVVLVGHEVAQRGWKDVRKGEVCKIPGIGPVAPQVAREIADDAFLSGVFYDGKDLRQFKRWGRNIPVEIAIALELGRPPGFDGIACVDCGNRFRTEIDHVQPRSARGPTSHPNLEPRCWPCHQEKSRREREAALPRTTKLRTATTTTQTRRRRE
jgi:hypothetical protein